MNFDIDSFARDGLTVTGAAGNHRIQYQRHTGGRNKNA
jgi:hypothetical protein